MKNVVLSTRNSKIYGDFFNQDFETPGKTVNQNNKKMLFYEQYI